MISGAELNGARAGGSENLALGDVFYGKAHF